MATRKVFIATKSGNQLVQSVNIEFQWYAGLSVSQKQRSILSLHSSFGNEFNFRVIEASTKSSTELGVKLSAFNLSFITKTNSKYNVESLFQGSKVFALGGPYVEIYDLNGREAKKRIKELSVDKGDLVAFKYKQEVWPLYPKTAFYDWMYMNMLLSNQELVDELEGYSAFTDIEFNEKKSINCQAYSLAVFVALSNRNMLHVLNSKREYLLFLKERNDILENQNGQLVLGNI